MDLDPTHIHYLMEVLKVHPNITAQPYYEELDFPVTSQILPQLHVSNGLYSLWY